jgi:hypothetical protein
LVELGLVVGEAVGEEALAEVLAEVGVILIPSAATFLGCVAGGGQRPMLAITLQPYLIQDMATAQAILMAHTCGKGSRYDKQERR